MIQDATQSVIAKVHLLVYNNFIQNSLNDVLVK